MPDYQGILFYKIFYALSRRRRTKAACKRKVSVVSKTPGTVTHRTGDLYGINNGLRRPRAGLAAVKMLGKVTAGGLIHP